MRSLYEQAQELASLQERQRLARELHDSVSQVLYRRAEALSKRARQSVPREFKRVASNLDESCGEEDFKKAWISIEWMNGCLNNFTKDAELGFCSINEGYSCAINARSDGCVQRR